MKGFGSVVLLAGIASVQVGDPLAHRATGFANGISSDRVTGGFVLAFSVAGSKDEDVAEFGLLVRESTEGAVLSEGGAEVFPLGEYARLVLAVLTCGGFGGSLERSSEMSNCPVSGGNCKSCQGRSCGYDWLK